MPILYKNNIVCHFAHIPKCGGSSVEAYCKSIGITTAFCDDTYITVPAPQKWNTSSPQHIDGYSLSRLFPPDFFDVGFAVVRNPVTRFISAFKFQRMSEHTLSGEPDINAFIKNDLRKAAGTLGAYDNHFLPQVNFLLPNFRYQIFKLEAGLENVKHFVDRKMLGADALPDIGHLNISPETEADCEQFEIAPDAMAVLKDVYQQDYINFRY